MGPKSRVCPEQKEAAASGLLLREICAVAGGPLPNYPVDPVPRYKCYRATMNDSGKPAYTRASLAKAAGVGVETLRFYERKQIMKPPERNRSGYRVYDTGDLERLQFVQRAQGLGFSLLEIKELMSLSGDSGRSRHDVRELAGARLTLIKEKVIALRAMGRALSDLIASCDGNGPIEGCPIIESISGKNNNSKGRRHER